MCVSLKINDVNIRLWDWISARRRRPLYIQKWLILNIWRNPKLIPINISKP